MKIIDLTNMIQSFDDTCTVLAGLDLLICCDTATAHIAGAMSVPVWIAIPYNPDWRWTISGNSTHWYDSMKIYRQIERDNWQTVFDEIKIDLEKIINKK
jgi:ADP-heptose:LPS heptosyltransferase